MTCGFGPSELEYPPDQQYRIFQIEFEDGSVRDYPCVWWSGGQMAQIPDEAVRREWDEARQTVLWLGFEEMFNGTLAGYPKAMRILRERIGYKDDLDD